MEAKDVVEEHRGESEGQIKQEADDNSQVRVLHWSTSFFFWCLFAIPSPVL